MQLITTFSRRDGPGISRRNIADDEVWMDVYSEYNMMVFVMLLGCLEICKIMIV